MNNETLGEAVWTMRVDDSEATQELSRWQANLAQTMADGKESTQTLADGFASLQDGIAQLATAGLALGGLTSGISSAVDAYNQYEASMNGVRAVASATGNDISQSMAAIKEVTAGGLLTQAEASTAMKNLQLYGYSVQEATEMIKIMTDAAAYNRQANYDLGESIVATTEGIRQENSVLSDASGITTNIAKMHENYATQIGKTTNELTQAEKAQAVYNGYLAEGNVFAGNAAEYSNTLAGSQQQLNASLQQVEQTIGASFNALTPFLSGLASWVSDNKELVASLTIFVGILAGGAGLVAAIKLAATAIGTFNNALTTLVGQSATAKGAVAGLVGVFGMLAANALVNSATESMGGFAKVAFNLPKSTDQAADSIKNLGVTSGGSASKIDNLTNSLARLDRDYAKNLKELAVRHEKNLATLTQQINDANTQYRRAIEKRNSDFNVTLAKQERSHQETVDELTAQLNFLQRYNNQYNREKLDQVQAALAIEQRLYEKETQALQSEMDLQNQADKEKLDQKLSSLQQELADEMAFMEKHRDALNSVRDVILEDEFESLTRQYEEQKASYEKQISEAGKAGANAGKAFVDNYTTELRTGLQVAQDMAIEAVNLGASLINKTKKSGNNTLFDSLFGSFGSKKVKGYDLGGYTGRGASDEVAGIVHKGEYVVPAKNVDQNTGQPMLAASQNITINLAGVLATSPQAKRDLAQEIVKAITQINQTRLNANTGAFR